MILELMTAVVLHAPFMALDIDVPGVCDSYGVNEVNTYYSDIVIPEALSYAELQVACRLAIRGDILAVHGCALYKMAGVVPYTEVYWLAGNFCAMIHEYCHAINMGGHTQEFINRLNAGDNDAACPIGETK